MKKAQVICDKCKEDCTNGLYTSFTIDIKSNAFHFHDKIVLDLCHACCKGIPTPDFIKHVLTTGVRE